MIRVGKYTIDESVINILYKVKSQLTNGKLKSIHKRAGQICITCPCHAGGQEDTPSCYINEDGIWNCFACHESGTFSKLIGECFDESEEFGRKWLIQNYVGDVIVEQQKDLFEDSLLPTNNTQYLDESYLDSPELEKWHSYMSFRHLSPNVCEKFKLRYDPQSKMIIFPVWDEHNRLLMLTRRSVEGKRFLIDRDKEKPVYLLNYVKNNGITSVIVCESQINTLTLYSYGYNSIGLFGTGTKYQYNILNKSGIRFYHLAFDGDEAGRKATKNFIENVKDAFIDVIIIPEGKDVNDLTKEEFDSLVRIDSDIWLEKYKRT